MKDISLCIMTRELCHELYKGWENDPDIYMDMDLFEPYQYNEILTPSRIPPVSFLQL